MGRVLTEISCHPCLQQRTETMGGGLSDRRGLRTSLEHVWIPRVLSQRGKARTDSSSYLVRAKLDSRLRHHLEDVEAIPYLFSILLLPQAGRLTSKETPHSSHSPKSLCRFHKWPGRCLRCFDGSSGLCVIDRVVFDTDLGYEVNLESI